MKTLTMKCKCGNQKVVIGETTLAILNAIDDSHWHDEPGPKGTIKFTCPDCQKKQEKEC
jgi:hypothetical protein